VRRARFGGLLVALALTASAQARAQCTSTGSSCVSCHEVSGAYPVLADGHAWHADHGFGDLCVACHGGDPAATSKADAHVAMRAPLEDVSRSCGGCHEDAAARGVRYRAQAIASAGPPGRGGPGAPLRAALSAPHDPSALPWSLVDRVLAGIVVVLGAVFALLVARDRHALGRLRPSRWLRATLWSPYVAGAGLGLTVAASEALLGRPIAASGAFDKLAAYPGRALFPKAPYYAYVMRPEISWQVWLMVGVLLGAFASAALAGVARRRWVPDTEWTERFGRRRSVRLLVAFFGAVLVQIGADIAGGCTSGLAISGGAVLSPAAFIFMAGMFAGGIPTAWLWYSFPRRRAETR
jgi:uncharacterized protein